VREGDLPDASGSIGTPFSSRIAEAGGANAAWIARLSQVIRGCEHFAIDAVCVGRPTASPAWIFDVHFKAASPVPWIRFVPENDCITFSERSKREPSGVREIIDDRPVGCASIGKMRTPLMALLREVLPQDTVLARLSNAQTAPSGSHQVLRFGGVIHVEALPMPIDTVPPAYPPDAVSREIQGTVGVEVLVGTDGTVDDAQILKSIPELDSAALEAARKWRFKPAIARGKPVAAWVAVPVRFEAP